MESQPVNLENPSAVEERQFAPSGGTLAVHEHPLAIVKRGLHAAPADGYRRDSSLG